MSDNVIIDKKLCPICGKENKCALENGEDSHKCWCMTAVFPKNIKRYNSCICEKCLEEMNDKRNV